jgi:sugar phosphate isomerase/epimerase
MRIGLQLYTVRNQLDADYLDTLSRVRGIGYTHVEPAGLGPYDAKELRRVLDEHDLTPTSIHCPIEGLEGNIAGAIANAKTLGVSYIVCPYLAEDRRKDENDWLACARILGHAGRACRDAGLTLCYHNHSFEFVKFGDRYAFDLLFDETEPDCLQAELDTYWIAHGGEDPVAYIEKFAGRCPILHLKDMGKDEKRSFAEVGAGVLDFDAIFNAADRTGVTWGIVEQDTCPGNPFDSIKKSYDYLNKVGRV